MSKDDLDPLRRVFGQLDEDNSGIVGRDELVEMFFKYMGDSVTDIELDRMLSIVDADMSGEIGFTEFVIACLNPHDVITTEHLRSLFNLYDADGSKMLSMREIKGAICAGRNIDERVWMAGVHYNFDEKAMQAYKNLSMSASMLGGTSLSQTIGGNQTGAYTNYTIESELSFVQFKDLLDRMFNIKKVSRRSTMNRNNRSSMLGTSMRRTTNLPGTVEDLS